MAFESQIETTEDNWNIFESKDVRSFCEGIKSRLNLHGRIRLDTKFSHYNLQSITVYQKYIDTLKPDIGHIPASVILVTLWWWQLEDVGGRFSMFVT